MEQSLKYLREILSSYIEDDPVGQRIYKQLATTNYAKEVNFVEDLNQEEINYMNKMLQKAIHYSEQEQDTERAQQLTEVYELLFI